MDSLFPNCGIKFIPSLENLIEKRKSSRSYLDGEVKLFGNFIYSKQEEKIREYEWEQINKFDTQNLSDKEKIRRLAMLHQQRERLHLFFDRNSRTNALILQNELVKNGLSPTFIDPNGSYLESVDSWAAIIAAGIDEIEQRYPITETLNL